MAGFGGRLRRARLMFAARRNEELSAAGLARLMGVQPSTVLRWEAAPVPPTDYPTVQRVATVLGVAPEWLAYGTGNPPALVLDDDGVPVLAPQEGARRGRGPAGGRGTGTDR